MSSGSRPTASRCAPATRRSCPTAAAPGPAAACPSAGGRPFPRPPPLPAGSPAGGGGQTAGGVAEGPGGALREPGAYGGVGQPLGGTLMDYAVPTAADVPPLELHHLETPAPSIAGGYKGAGEAGTTGAPAAILNAVNDALAPFGVMITDQPITAERVVRAVREGGRRRGR